MGRWRHCVSWSLGCLTSTWDIPTFDIVRCTLGLPKNVKCWDVPCAISNALVQQPNHPLTNGPTGRFAFANSAFSKSSGHRPPLLVIQSRSEASRLVVRYANELWVSSLRFPDRLYQSH